MARLEGAGFLVEEVVGRTVVGSKSGRKDGNRTVNKDVWSVECVPSLS